MLATAVDDRAQGAARDYRIEALRDTWIWVEDRETVGNVWNLYFPRTPT